MMELMSSIENYKVDIYRKSKDVLDQEFSRIIAMFNEFIQNKFDGNVEILETNNLLLEKAYEFLKNNDFMLRSAFLEMEIQPILDEIGLLEGDN